MTHNKRLFFAEDQRLIGEYKLYQKGGEMRLRAEARDPLRNTELDAETVPTHKKKD